MRSSILLTVLLTQLIHAQIVSPNVPVSAQLMLERIRKISTEVTSFKGKFHVKSEFLYADAPFPVKEYDCDFRGAGDDYWAMKSPFGDMGDSQLTEALYNGKYSYRLDRPTPQEPTWNGEILRNQDVGGRQTSRVTSFFPTDLFRLFVDEMPLTEILDQGENFVLSDETGSFLSLWSSDESKTPNVDVYFHPDGQLDRILKVVRFGFHSPAALAARIGISEHDAAAVRIVHSETNYLRYVDIGGLQLPSQIEKRIFHISKNPEIRALREKVRGGQGTWPDYALQLAEISRKMKPGVRNFIDIDLASSEVNVNLTMKDFEIPVEIGSMVFDADTGETFQAKTWAGNLLDQINAGFVWLRQGYWRLSATLFALLGIFALWLRAHRKTA